MRVLQLFNSFERGGTELQTLQLVRALCERLFEVHVAAQREHGPLLEEVGRLGLATLTFFPLTSLKDRNALIQAGRFRAHLRRHRIQVLHTHDFYTNVFGLPCGWRTPAVVRIGSKRETSLLPRTRQWAEAAAFRLADAVVANCDAAAARVRGTGIDSARIVTIRNGVHVAPAPRPHTREQVLERYGLGDCETGQMVLMVGNLRHVLKDHPTLLRAARRVLAVRPHCTFVVAGEGELLARMRTLVGQMNLVGHVHFIGHSDDIQGLVNAADVCVLSSRSEGLSNAILEYMAGARPVVATDVGGAREAVIHGVTGYLVPAGDATTLADRILALLADPALGRRMGECGRSRAARSFSIMRRVERTCALYERLVAARAARGPHRSAAAT